MVKLKIAAAVAVALVTPLTSTQVVAQSFGEPAAFQAQHPDRDVLNGGVLTPAARAAAGLESSRGVAGTVGVTNPAYARRTHARFRRHR